MTKFHVNSALAFIVFLPWAAPVAAETIVEYAERSRRDRIFILRSYPPLVGKKRERLKKVQSARIDRGYAAVREHGGRLYYPSRRRKEADEKKTTEELDAISQELNALKPIESMHLAGLKRGKPKIQDFVYFPGHTLPVFQSLGRNKALIEIQYETEKIGYEAQSKRPYRYIDTVDELVLLRSESVEGVQDSAGIRVQGLHRFTDTHTYDTEFGTNTVLVLEPFQIDDKTRKQFSRTYQLQTWKDRKGMIIGDFVIDSVIKKVVTLRSSKDETKRVRLAALDKSSQQVAEDWLNLRRHIDPNSPTQ